MEGDKEGDDGKSLDDGYVIELIGRLTMVKNEMEYNKITNFIWLVLLVGMVAVI